MPKGTGINNDVYIVGSLELQDELFLGFTTQSGASRQITAQGSATDVHIELLPKGDGVIRTRTGYAADILDDRDIINLEYFKTRLGTLATSSLLQAPTATEDTYGIVYDHANTRFTLAPTGASLTFDNGLTKSGSNVRLGGALLVDTTITGAFDINLGTIGSKLNNFNVHTSQGVDIRGLVHGRVRIDGTNGQTWIYGGSVDSYLLVNDDGAIIVADLQAGAAQRGIRGSANYSANYQANDYIQKLYADSKIVSRNISASLASPGAGQNGYAITWDHANSRFTLSLAGGGGGGVGLPINDNQVLIQNLADNTKQFRFDAGSISTSTIRVYTVPNTNGTLALISNITAAQAGAWSLASGGTLIDNNTITMGSHTITFTGNRVTFTPNATTAGLNVGSFSTSPSSLALGDIWYNSSVDNFQGRVATGTRLLTVSIGIVDTRIPFGLGTINELTTSANFTYNGTTLLVGGTSPTASTTLDVRGIGTTSSTFGLRVANSANVTRLTLNDEGTLNLTTTVTTHTWIGTSYQGWSSLVGAGGGANIQVGQIISIAGGTNPFRFDLSSIPTGGAAMEIRETTSDTNIGGANSGAFILTKGGFTRNSGTNTHTHLQLNPTYNTTASYSGTINGIDYNPTLTSLTGATHIAWRNTSGSMLIGGTSLTNANTILDIQSTTQGFALPRMTDTQRNAIGSPYSGLQIHSTTSNRPNWHNGTVWQETASRSDLNGWLTGSLNSNTSIDYSGYEITFNAGDGLGGGGRFRVFNQEAVEEVFFGEAGNVGQGGLKYGNDYSANYTDRSLVDRGYVLSAKTFTGRQTFATGNNGSLVVGTNTVDDSSPVNGLIMYNTTSNTFRFRQNGAWVGLGGGGGITNSAPNGELMKSDGTNAVSSGITANYTGGGSLALSGSATYGQISSNSSNGEFRIATGILNNTNTSNIVISTGNAQGTSGGYNSGDVLIHTGTKYGTGTRGNVALFTDVSPTWQGMERGIFMSRATNAPTGNPADGAFFYVDPATDLPKWRVPGGTVYTLTDTGAGATYYAPTSLVVHSSNADYTAVANSVLHLPDGVLSANRTLTIPTSANGDVLEIYCNEDTYAWNLAGATVYLADRTTVVTQLLFNVPTLMQRINGLWIIKN